MMAGKICNGTTAVPTDPKESRAYCEGRRAAIDGVDVADNPLPAGSPSSLAWVRGWGSVGGGDEWPRDCCADRGSDVVPDPG